MATITDGKLEPETSSKTRNQTVSYHPDAVAQFRKLDYLTSLNGHCEFQSANTLRNSIVNPINMDSKFNRFKVAPKGGYFSNT